MADPPLKSITHARPSRYADIPAPITEADAHAEPPAERLMDETPHLVRAKSRGRLRTAFEYRGYHLTITARGMTLDAFYAAIETDADYPFTVCAGITHDDGRFTEIEFEDMTINDFCDMLDRKFGVPS